MTVKAMRKGFEKYKEPKCLFSEDQALDAFNFLRSRLSGIWDDSKVLDYAEAVKLMDMTKSPGYPYYYDCDTKEVAFQKYGDVIQDASGRIMKGEEVECVSASTLKDELRPEEKVNEDKTRIFNGCPVHHLAPSTQLFEDQNNRLMETLGEHPVTIGIQVPGPQLVSAIMNLFPKAWDADGAGWDTRCNLTLARVVCLVRASFLPQQYFDAVFWLYCTIYCGVVVALGVMYRLYHQKSGWKNTGHDNSLIFWLALYLAWRALAPPNMNFDEFVRLLINGDDLDFSEREDAPVGLPEMAHWLKQYNVMIELARELPVPPSRTVFLSHSIFERFVPHLGDLIVAGGNLPKLLSSLDWIRKSSTLEFEELCVAHLLGVRLCLFPWRIHFLECEELLDKFLSCILVTPKIKLLLRGRLTEYQIALLHMRVEVSFSLDPLICQVLKELSSPDKMRAAF